MKCRRFRRRKIRRRSCAESFDVSIEKKNDLKRNAREKQARIGSRPGEVVRRFYWNHRHNMLVFKLFSMRRYTYIYYFSFCVGARESSVSRLAEERPVLLRTKSKTESNRKNIFAETEISESRGDVPISLGASIPINSHQSAHSKRNRNRMKRKRSLQGSLMDGARRSVMRRKPVKSTVRGNVKIG